MGYLQQNIIVQGFFKVEHIGKVFHHSVEFVGHAGKSVNTVLHKLGLGLGLARSEGATGLETRLYRRRLFSNQRSSMAILFCYSYAFLHFCCLSAPPGFLTFSTAPLVLLCKILYCRCSSRRMKLFTLALCRCIYVSLFFLNRLVNSFETQSCIRPKGGQGVHVPLPRGHL